VKCELPNGEVCLLPRPECDKAEGEVLRLDLGEVLRLDRGEVLQLDRAELMYLKL